jgi:uncharacterized protein with HEPN domain
MSRNIRLYLEDILGCCAKVLRYTQDITFEQFITDEKTFDAVARNLQIIGEAVKNIPPKMRSLAPEIEWRKIAGLRDILAHTYFQIENEIIWDIVQNKVQPLQAQIQQLWEHEFGEHTKHREIDSREN